MGDAPAVQKGYCLWFEYDARGFGMLELHNDHLIPWHGMARTGSIDRHGELINPILPGVWTLRKPPVDTEEAGMTITSGNGWKCRLWTPMGVWSRYLVHPDGNRPGTLGCIGLQGTDGLDLRVGIDYALRHQARVPVYVNTPLPEEGIYV